MRGERSRKVRPGPFRAAIGEWDMEGPPFLPSDWFCFGFLPRQQVVVLVPSQSDGPRRFQRPAAFEAPEGVSTSLSLLLELRFK